MDGTPHSDTLMPIGRFARACRLTVKALRHYHELGLLRPAVVDRQTGYRYYTRAQARDAVVIAMLRSLDVPLPAIRALLAAGDAAAVQRLVAEQHTRLKRQVARTGTALRALERLMRAGDLLPHRVAVRQQPDQHVLRLGCRTAAERLDEDTVTLVRRVYELAGRLGCVAFEPVLCLVPALDEPMEVEVCLPVDRTEGAIEDGTIGLLPGGPMAVVRHVGPYDELGLAHHALFAWAQEHGHDVAGPLREAYINDPDEVDPDELVTDVMLPIAGVVDAALGPSSTEDER